LILQGKMTNSNSGTCD